MSLLSVSIPASTEVAPATPLERMILFSPASSVVVPSAFVIVVAALCVMSPPFALASSDSTFNAPSSRAVDVLMLTAPPFPESV